MSRKAGNIETNVREVLIIVEYLLKYTDAKHYAFATQIVKYAKEQYGIDIRRQRVKLILDTLYQYVDNCENLGFVLDAEQTGQSLYRYYVKQRYFDEKDIIDIGKAIENYRYMDNKENLLSLNRFVSFFSNDYNYQKLIDNIHKDNSNISHITQRERKMYKQLSIAKDKRMYVTIKLFSPLKDNIVSGYVYDIIEHDNNYLVYLVNVNKKELISYGLKSISRIISIVDFENAAPNDLNTLFSNSTYKTIEEYIKNAGILISGKIIDVEFDVTVSNKVKDSFRLYFKYPMPYQPIVKPIKLIDTPNSPVINVHLNHVKIKVDQRSFVDWLINGGVIDNIRNISNESVKQELEHYYQTILKRI